ARTTRGTNRREYVRVQRLKAPGWRSTARSCTVTTSGTCERGGPRKLGQCSTSTARARRGSVTGYHHASRATVAPLPAPPNAQRLLERRRDRLGALRVGADGRVAARLVERRVRRRHDRRAARGCLEHGYPEALEPRRIDEDGGAAIQARELCVGDVSELDHTG